MEINDLKKHCNEYLIFDAVQYYESALKNYQTASFCCNLIQRLIIAVSVKDSTH